MREFIRLYFAHSLKCEIVCITGYDRDTYFCFRKFLVGDTTFAEVLQNSKNLFNYHSNDITNKTIGSEAI